MKESRLFKIVYHLLNNGRTSAPELASEFEVSVRTIYRDIDALSAAGIPIYAETGRNGGIAILDHFVLDKMLLSDKEKRYVLSSLQSLSVLDYVYEKEMLTKLSALFHTQSENWFEVDFSRWYNGNKDDDKFELLKEAIVNRRTVMIGYVSSNGHQRQREVNPLKFLYKSKAWYIRAYCLHDEAFRTFKFNRIVDVKIMDKVFQPMVLPDLHESQTQNYNKIILRFPKEMAYRIYDEFDATQIVEEAKGILLVTSEMPEDAWLVGYLLSFGSQVEVIEPVYLREVLATEAKKIFEKNKP